MTIALPARYVLMAAWLGAVAACDAPTQSELMTEARAAIAAGDPRSAQIHLRNVLQGDPSNVAARTLLGQVYLARGDPVTAERTLRQAEDLGADAAATRLPLLLAMLAQSKFDDVLAQTDSAPAGVDRAVLLTIRGSALRSKGLLEEAEAAYRSAIELDPESFSARTELAAVLFDTGRKAEAEQAIAAVLSSAPDFAAAWLVRGTIEQAARLYDRAEASFAHAIRLEGGERSPRAALALGRLIEAQIALRKLDAAAGNADALLALTPGSSLAGYLRARVDVELQRLDDAERRLESLLVAAPTYAPALRLLGTINTSQGQTGQALMYLRAAVNSDPADTATRLLLAELHIRNDDVEAAKSLFADPASFDATDGLFLALAGRLSLQAGRSDLATAYFDRSEQSRPSTARELVGVTSIYVAAGEFERSIRLLQEATPDDAASGLVRDYLLALMQARQGDLDAAAATADRLRAAQPDASWPLNLRGAIALAANDFQAAKDLYTEALNLEPNNVAASLNLARVAVALGDTGEATRHLVRVVAIDPLDTTANFGLAQLAAQRGDVGAAHSFLARAAESPLRLRLQGELYTAEGRFAEAAAAFGRAFELQPSSDLAFSRYAAATRAGLPEPESSLLVWAAQNPRDVQVHYVLGLLAQAAGDSDAAMRRYEGVIEIAPQHAAALNNLAGIYSQRGDARALELAARAHAASPGDPAVADTLGWIHVGSGNPRAGLPLLEQARAGLPDHPEIRYHWTVALAETGNREQALRELRALLSSGVAFPSRSDAQRYLRGLEEQG